MCKKEDFIMKDNFMKNKITRQKFRLENCVWEITMRCNLSCRHCGSSCGTGNWNTLKAQELNEEQAKKTAAALKNMKVQHVTLIGGEVLCREDWPVLVREMAGDVRDISLVTNGILLDKQVASDMKKSGVTVASVSLEGPKKEHDFIRGKGSFEKCQLAYEALHHNKVQTGANTTVMKENIGTLETLKKELIYMGVSHWQLQMGLPMGRMKGDFSQILSPCQVMDLITFVRDTNREGKIRAILAESVGYYSKEETEGRFYGDGGVKLPVWMGCNAGIRSVGILHNGDVVGCTSIRSRELTENGKTISMVEGNLKNQSLEEIWNSPDTFLWRRKMESKQLHGFCQNCKYSNLCLGGCTNTKLTLCGGIYEENKYCTYFQEKAGRD